MKSKKIYANLPQDVKDILFLSEGYLVGSSVRNILEDVKEIKDYDILVTDPLLFRKVCATYKNEMEGINTFGGIKLQLSEGSQVDIWCDALEAFLTYSSTYYYVYSLKNNTLFKNENL